MRRLTSDIGFSDRGLIRPLLDRVELRSAVSNLRVSTRTLLDLLNQRREADGGNLTALREQAVRLTACDQERGSGRITIEVGDRDTVREQELLEGVELVLQLLDRLDTGIRHGLFSFEDARNPIRAEQAGQSLCDDAIQTTNGGAS